MNIDASSISSAIRSSRYGGSSGETVAKKRIELPEEFRRRGEETQRILRERLEFHARRRAERDAREERPK